MHLSFYERDCTGQMNAIEIHLLRKRIFSSVFLFFGHQNLGPVPIAVPQPEPHSVGGVLVHMPHVCSVCINSKILDVNPWKFHDEIFWSVLKNILKA